MKVNIEKVDWHLPKEINEGTITFSIDGKKYRAFSALYDYPVGSIVDVEFSFFEKSFIWEEIFQGNPHKKRELVSTGEWSYEAFGQIISINPVQADFGPIILNLGVMTHDERVIGEYILLKISQLIIFPKKTT